MSNLMASAKWAAICIIASGFPTSFQAAEAYANGFWRVFSLVALLGCVLIVHALVIRLAKPSDEASHVNRWRETNGRRSSRASKRGS